MLVRLISFAFLLFAAPVNAALVHITWSEQGEFRHQQTLEAGGFAEVCGALIEGEQIRWSFEAGDVLDFNIHYHEDEEVVYPVKAESQGLANTLLAAVDQTYCWMWTNQKEQPVQLSLQLFQGAR